MSSLKFAHFKLIGFNVGKFLSKLIASLRLIVMMAPQNLTFNNKHHLLSNHWPWESDRSQTCTTSRSRSSDFAMRLLLSYVSMCQLSLLFKSWHAHLHSTLICWIKKTTWWLFIHTWICIMQVWNIFGITIIWKKNGEFVFWWKHIWTNA